MCGITGFVDFQKKTSSLVLQQMTDALHHRGPDDGGCEVYNSPYCLIGFGQRRLSILDLSPQGHQPMHSENLVVNFNGEIYNFKEIRKELEDKGFTFSSYSDTEVILKGYQCWGIDVVEKFTGMFAIALYDKQQQKLILIRDRAGVKPLYYYWHNDLFIFGSELKSFFQHPEFKKEININSLSLFLQYSYIPGRYSIFNNTHKLLPGHFFVFDFEKKQYTTTRYWDVFDYYNQPKIICSDKEAIEHTDKILKKAYEYRMVADVPVGIFLSGGYDSASVAALLQTERTEKLKTFTIGFHEQEFNEAPEAKKIADYLGTDHTEMYVTAKEAGEVLPLLPEIYDEPFADNSTVPTVLVSKLAKQQVKVALSADGGDEIFGGYNKFNQATKFTGDIPVILQKIAGKSMSLINPEYIPYFNKQYNFATRYEKMKLIWKSQSAVQAVKYISQYITESETKKILLNSFQSYSTVFDDGHLLKQNDGVLNHLLAIDYKTFLVDNNLVKVDRASMSVGLEGREPMLDQKIIEFTATLPSSFKIRNGVNKWLLKEIVHSYLPKELMDRPKRPFIAPLMVWFKDELKEQLLYYLNEASLKKSGVFNAKTIISLRDDFLNGKKINYQKLWQVLIFQLWYNRWIEKL